MIRTRDAFLLCLIIVILSILVLLTVLFKTNNTDTVGNLLSPFAEVTEQTFSVEKVEKEFDRTTTIERLRSLLAKGASVVVPQPSVEEESIADAPSDAESENTNNILLSCKGDDSERLRASWPKDVFVVIEGGSRVFNYNTFTTKSVETAGTTTSSSSPQVITHALLSTRAFPVKMNEPSCVPGSIVGVRQTGAPIYNEASSYTEFGPDSLIGFARDGFPIYGFYEGETDSCGGYSHPNGYRYTLSKERNTILNCYFAPPASFSRQ